MRATLTSVEVQRIKTLRQNGLTARQIAERFGVTPAAIYRNCSNKNTSKNHPPQLRVGGIRRNYCLVAPDGTRYKTDNLREFAAAYDLSSTCLSHCASGRQTTHKDWRCNYV